MNYKVIPLMLMAFTLGVALGIKIATDAAGIPPPNLDDTRVGLGKCITDNAHLKEDIIFTLGELSETDKQLYDCEKESTLIRMDKDATLRQYNTLDFEFTHMNAELNECKDAVKNLRAGNESDYGMDEDTPI